MTTPQDKRARRAHNHYSALTLPGLQALAILRTGVLVNHAGSHAFSLPGSIFGVEDGFTRPGTRDEVSAMAADGTHVQIRTTRSVFTATGDGTAHRLAGARRCRQERIEHRDRHFSWKERKNKQNTTKKRERIKWTQRSFCLLKSRVVFGCIRGCREVVLSLDEPMPAPFASRHHTGAAPKNGTRLNVPHHPRVIKKKSDL